MLLRILTDSSLFCAISAMNCLVAEWLLQKHQTGQLLGPYDQANNRKDCQKHPGLVKTPGFGEI